MKRTSHLWRFGGVAILGVFLAAGAEVAAQQQGKQAQPPQKTTPKKVQPPGNDTPPKGTVTVTPPKGTPTTANPAPKNPAPKPGQPTGPTIVSGQPFPALIGLGPPSFAGPVGYFQRYYGPNGPGANQVNPLLPNYGYNPGYPYNFNNPYAYPSYGYAPLNNGMYNPYGGYSPYSPGYSFPSIGSGFNPFGWYGY